MTSPNLPERVAPYQRYALVYDQTGQLRFSIMMAMYLREVLQRYPPPGRRMLDLACGTGTLALMQAEAGWEVIGLDRSTAMLAQARGKSVQSGLDVRWIEADMCCFSLEQTVDLTTSFYDSLNYLLTPDDLLGCFRSVAAVLAPGGLWCFDLATDYFLRTYWRGVEHEALDDYEQVMESSYDETSGYSRLVLTGTHRQSKGDEQPFQEVHVERAYAPEQIERLLSLAGLEPVALLDCFTFQPPRERSLRHFWVARKPVQDVAGL
jgi:ubiquinone/menaquinone biosynthesis C-methylase UbiE